MSFLRLISTKYEQSHEIKILLPVTFIPQPLWLILVPSILKLIHRFPSSLSGLISLGVACKTSDTTEVFFKSTGIVTPELDTLLITNGTYGNGTIGVRFLF